MDLKDLQSNLRSSAFAAIADDESHDEFCNALVTKDDHEIADAIHHLTGSAPPPVTSVVLSVIRDAVGQDRYVDTIRSAGLANYLDLPYTGTGVELMGETEERYVLEALRSKRLWRYEVPSSRSFVGRFEQAAESLLGVKHVHATVSGSAALHVALLALGVGPGDEVIVPAVTWVGCADAVILCGAVPVIAQVDETLGLSVTDVARNITERTRAVMAVSLYGAPCDLGPLRAITDKHGIALLEDNCQAAGVSYRGHRLGSIGDAAAFSLKFMKFIAAGDGGFLATNSDAIYQFAVQYMGGRTFPARKRAIAMDDRIMPATGLRMNELTGAVALAQIERLDQLLGRLRAARDLIFELAGPPRTYRRVLGNDPSGDSGWMTPLIFSEEDTCRSFVRAVRARGVRHITTSRELFAGGEIEHCYAAMSADRYLPTTGAHWAADFRAMVEKKSLDPRFNPWTHPLYNGDVNYPKGFMDESFAVINRLAMIQTNPRLEPEHCKVIADAIRGADDQVAGLLRRSDGPIY